MKRKQIVSAATAIITNREAEREGGREENKKKRKKNNNEMKGDHLVNLTIGWHRLICRFSLEEHARTQSRSPILPNVKPFKL